MIHVTVFALCLLCRDAGAVVSGCVFPKQGVQDVPTSLGWVDRILYSSPINSIIK